MDSERSPRRQRLVIAAVLSGLLLAMLDQTIVGTALPRIVGELGGSSLYLWVVTAYLVPATVSLPIYARLSDRHGRRALLLIGMALFLRGLGAVGVRAGHGAADRLARRCRASAPGRSRACRSSSSPTSSPAAAARRCRARWRASWASASSPGRSSAASSPTTSAGAAVFTVNLPIGLAALAIVAPSLPASIGEASGAATPLDVRGHRAADALDRPAARRALERSHVTPRRVPAGSSADRRADRGGAARAGRVRRRRAPGRGAGDPARPARRPADRPRCWSPAATGAFGLFAGALLLPRYFQTRPRRERDPLGPADLPAAARPGRRGQRRRRA